jgi:O-acetyl-ADP-ribose deacetylase (regulator of RNase III)
MIKHIKCDIFESGANIICHQVNCQGVMGSGIAKQVKEKYPNVYKNYKKWCDNKKPEDLLGEIQYVTLNSDDKFFGIMNVFGQLNYGYDGKCYTDYEALRNSFTKIHEFCEQFYKFHAFLPEIAFPYKFGCARGGGDWDIVYKMIEETLRDCNILICEYDGG